jgi:hypothetical protein
VSRTDECLELLRGPEPDREAISKLFEEAPPVERVEILRAIDGRGQAKLWESARGRKVSIQEMVPRDTGPLTPVVFHGKNSLPAFSHFQKCFCRPEATEADELWGYNYQPTRWLGRLTGPGYFVAYDSDSPVGSVAVDYRRVPTARPETWPEIHDNTYRLSRFIFNGMVDYLRRISEHLLIGRATRGDREMDNYFLLCREDPPSS